jgi:hypothetical protein
MGEPQEPSIPSIDSNVPAQAAPALDGENAPVAQPPVEDGGDSAFLDMVRASNQKPEGDDGGKKEEGKKEEEGQGQAEGEQVLTPPDPDPEESGKKGSKTENIKNLRNALKAERTKTSELQGALDAAKKQAENPELPEDVQSQLAAGAENLKKVEKYESLLGLYQSEEFKETYYDGVDTLVAEAKAIADDYEVDHSIIEQALATPNRKALIDGLGSYFDMHTAGELRDKILKAQGLIKEREEAENNPDKAKQELLANISGKSKANQEKAYKEMATLTQAAWHKMLDVYGDSNTGLDVLKEVSGDSDHMAKRDELLGKAQSELGKVMGTFVQNGLKVIPETLAQALVARFQLSEVTGVLHSENKSLKEQVASLQAQLDKQSKYSRPLANGHASGSGAPTPEAPKGGDIASHVMSKAIEKTSG